MNSDNMILNAIREARTRLARAIGYTHEGERNTFEVFGYPREIEIQALWERYKRGGIEQRIIRAFSQATWRDDPVVEENDDPKTETDFERTVRELNERIHLWATLERLDRLASVGRYGVLVIGLNDGRPMHMPVQRATEVTYLRPFSERSVNIQRLDTDAKSPRFGLPVLYQITTQDVNQVGRQQYSIHWTRVLHVTEFPEEDEAYGTPRLEAIYNRLLDLDKVVGGGSEAFWLNANAGLAFLAQSDASLTGEDLKDMKEQADEYQHKLRRVLAMQGVDVQQLATTIADPSNHADMILDQISGTTGIPKRILTGSEQGELASSQDETNWQARIDERRNNYAAPRIVKPLLQKLGGIGVLTVPEQFNCYWPESDTLDPAKKAEVNLNKARALATYSNAPQAAIIMPEREFRQEIMGLEPVPEGGFVSELQDLPVDEEDDDDDDEPGNGGGNGE